MVTHGNGPQVGLLALAPDAPPLDVLDAESQGLIGYLLGAARRTALPGREVVTLLTSVLVDPADPAFDAPTKPIGPAYTQAEAHALATARGWQFAPDGAPDSARYRRVVASPQPHAIVELAAVRTLLAAGMLVVCAGGGGIPVRVDAGGALHGIEAVVDKDLTAALLARQLEADVLLLLTDVPAVETDWRTPTARALRRATPAQLRSMRFAAGSMTPKVEAACRFVEATGGFAAIGAMQDAAALLRGEAGTRITLDAIALQWWDG